MSSTLSIPEIFIIFLLCLMSFSFVKADPNLDQWLDTEKTYKDLINEGFEVKSYTFNNVETANELYILLFILPISKMIKSKKI